MKSKIALVLLSFSFLILSSCVDYAVNSISGNGNVESEIREVDDFHGIEAASGLRVFVNFGEMSNEVEIVADENLHEYIITEVDNGILKIKSRRNIRRAASKEVFIKAGEIDVLQASSASDIIGENLLVTDKININVSSAGELDIEIQADEIDLEVSSSGSATLEGDTRQLIADVSSAGNLNAFNLIAEHVDVDASSAADAKVHASRSLRANASSAGNVKYKGNPESKNTSSSSAGNVSGD